jgi:hypothetical protein
MSGTASGFELDTISGQLSKEVASEMFKIK